MRDFFARLFGLHTEDVYLKNRLRPPGAVEENRFHRLCIRCNRCVAVCPYNSIKRYGLSASIGTPYIFPERKACYLCMACVKLCPTGALDPNLSIPEKAGMGRAVIDTSICYSHLFYDMDVLPDHTGKKIAAVCNTCYNVCPLQGIAIRLKHNLAPEILDGCVGCGICVERCPTRPRRAVEVYPTGMGRKDEAGFYHARRKRAVEGASTPPKKSGPLSIEETLERKEHLGGHDLQFNAPKNPKGTERPDE